MATNDVLRIAREIDAYAGAAGDVQPIGTVAVPIRLLVALRQALREAK